MKMNNILKNILAVLVLSGMLVSCNFEEKGLEEDNKQPQMSEDVLQGQLLVRFDQSVSKLLSQAGLTKSAATKSGVTSVDQVLSILEGCSLERVFPVDSRTEDKAVKSGLDLWYIVRFSEDIPVDQVAAKLAPLGEVSRVEYNRAIRKAYDGKVVPLSVEQLNNSLTKASNSAKWNDPLLGQQWHLVNDGNLGSTKFLAGCDVNVLDAWDKCTGDPSIIVAVMDEGVDVFHEDLAANMWVNEGEIWRSKEDNDGNGYAGDVYGYNFAKNSGVVSVDSYNDSGHGTHVAGVIAAQNDNGIGISSIAGGNGSAPGVKIMSCQIFSGNYTATILDEVRAIKYAADNGAVILQCSWGYSSGASNPYEWTPMYSTDEQWKADCPLEALALDYFVNYAGSPDGVVEGGIVVFAGGNEDAPAAGYPGAYGDFVSVAATAADFTPAVYTNYGTGINISAPGGDQDYYWDYDQYGELGAIGCVLSTLPKSVSESGYGYMEGTSMACPHVSGVVALGLSYAAKQKKHFKAKDFIGMLYDSAIGFENNWNVEQPKVYYRYVADIGLVHRSSFDLKEYRNKMGCGMVNAEGLLNLVDSQDLGYAMSFPNVTVALGEQASYSPSYYLKGSSFTVSVEDSSVATAEMDGNRLIIKGLKVGQTKASISGDASQDFIITVKPANGSNGWL